MGNLCNCLTKFLCKDQIKSEIMHLLHMIINDDDGGNCFVDNKRLMKFKNLMSIVRGMSSEWNVMTNQCIIKGCKPQTVVKNIIELLSESEESLKIGNILCLCTYVTDVCVMIQARNKSMDVFKCIDVLVDYVIEKNIVMCVTNCIQCFYIHCK